MVHADRPFTVICWQLRCHGDYSAVAWSPCAGIFVNLSVRKPLVIDYKLPYPTGTATGVMINSFFTNGARSMLSNLSAYSCCATFVIHVCDRS